MYAVTPAPLPGFSVSVDNSDGTGPTLTMWPGQRKTLSINYSPVTAGPEAPFTRVRACPSLIEKGSGESAVEVYAMTTDAWLPGASVGLFASGIGNQFGTNALVTPAQAPARTTFRSLEPGLKRITAVVSANGRTLAVDTTLRVANRNSGISLVKVAGDNQAIPVGTAGATFVVEVRDATSRPMDGVPIGWTFGNCFHSLSGNLGESGRDGAIFVPPYPNQPMWGYVTAEIIGASGVESVRFFFRFISSGQSPLGNMAESQTSPKRSPVIGPPQRLRK